MNTLLPQACTRLGPIEKKLCLQIHMYTMVISLLDPRLRGLTTFDQDSKVLDFFFFRERKCKISLQIQDPSNPFQVKSLIQVRIWKFTIIHDNCVLQINIKFPPYPTITLLYICLTISTSHGIKF